MATQRVTITLPDDLATKLRRKARDRKTPLSRVISEDLEALEEIRIAELMREGYREFSALNKELAEEFWPSVGETLSDDLSR